MNIRTIKPASLFILALSVSMGAFGQVRPDAANLITSQRDAMVALDAMNGVWRGSAWTILPSGEKRTITQTERIGPFLQGSVKVIEGRGYDQDGNVTFNAFGIISFDSASRSFNFRSYAQGQVGDFVFKPTTDGYTWEIPAGPATIRYVAVINNGTLREVGDRLIPGKEPVRFFEMNLIKLNESDWPAAGAIAPK